MIRFVTCRGCSTRLELECGLAASTVYCPTCDATVEVPAAEVGPGITVGGFAIENLISVGGMGKLFLARQLSMDRLVALKILPPQFCADRKNVERFLNEVRMVARLQHPNIVSAYEAGVDEGVYYLAMQYIKGRSLADIILSDGPLSEPEALRIGRKLAGALGHAWDQHQILHRDVKPENILLDEAGEPHLVDMGISKSMTSSRGMTTAGTVMGTPNYMSPEQMEDLASADSRADMFSLGATLYHALTGEIPFGGKTVLQTLQHMAMDTLPDPRSVVPALTRHCADLLRVMLARKPAARHQSWKELIADMDCVLRKFPIRARVPAGSASLIRPQSGVGGTVHIKKHTVHIKHAELAKHHSPATAKHKTAGGKTQGLDSPPKKTSRRIPIAIAATVIIGLAMAAVAVIRIREAKRRAVVAQQVEVREAALERQLTEAVAQAQSQPDAFDAVQTKLEALEPKLAGTKLEGRAASELRRLQDEHALALDAAWQTLRERADRIFSEGKVEESLALLRDYNGAFADALDPLRVEHIATLTNQAGQQLETEATRKVEAVQVARDRLDQLVADVARDLLAGRTADVCESVRAADADGSLDIIAETWNPLHQRILAVATVDAAILESFRKDVGQRLSVGLKSGARMFNIKSVENDQIVAVIYGSGGATITQRFGVADLDVRERYARAGKDDTGAGRLRQGLIAAWAKSYTAAAECFQQEDGPLAQALYLSAKDQ